MGCRIAPVPESPVARGSREPVRDSCTRTAPRDSANRRHLLPDALDRVDAWRTPFAGGGRRSARVPCEGERLSGTPAVGDPHGVGRVVPRLTLSGRGTWSLVRPIEALRSGSTLDPRLRSPRSVVGTLDVPMLPSRVVHGRFEIERSLEFDVVEAGLRRGELVPFTGGNQDETPGSNRYRAPVVPYFAMPTLDQIEMLRCDAAGRCCVMDMARRVAVRHVPHAAKL